MTDGWIWEIRIERQGGTEVNPLLAQPLLSHILSISRSHGFLRIVEITQESSSGDRGDICHKPSCCVYATVIFQIRGLINH